MAKSRLLTVAVLMMLVLGVVGAQSASAGLVYSVYLEPGGAYSGPETQNATFTTGQLPVGSVLTFKVYVTVSGTDADPANDGLASASYNVMSNTATANVAIKGTMSAPVMIATLPGDFNAGTAPTVKDLNADTVYNDLGSTLATSATGWAFSRNSSGTMYNLTTPIAHPSMTFSYTVGQDKTGAAAVDAYNPGGAALVIAANQRVNFSGTAWVMDGVNLLGSSAGITSTPVTINLATGGGPANPKITLSGATNPTIFVNGATAASVTVANTGDAGSSLTWGATVSGTGVTVTGAAPGGTLLSTDAPVLASQNVSSATVGTTPLAWAATGNAANLPQSANATLTVLAHSTLSLSGSSAVSTDTVALGNLLKGSIVSYGFNVANYAADVAFTAKADITSVTADAGLTTSVVPATDILAGTSSIYTVGYSTATSGSFTRVLTINGNDAASQGGINGWGNAKSLTITLTGMVGSATAGTGGSFGAPLTAPTPAGSSYAGLESTVGGGAGALGTTAKILWGTNNAGGLDNSVSMAWRSRNPADPNEMILGSDVLSLTGMVNSGAASGQTDKFVLAMSFDPAALLALGKGTLAEMQAKGLIYLGSNDGLVGAGAWQNAVDGNFGNDPLAKPNQGAFDAGNPDDLRLGSWGVDLTNSQVWAVLNHNSTFAAVPEPATMAFLLLGGLAMATPALRRRRTAK